VVEGFLSLTIVMVIWISTGIMPPMITFWR
jgi:hypothetical protein